MTTELHTAPIELDEFPQAPHPRRRPLLRRFATAETMSVLAIMLASGLAVSTNLLGAPVYQDDEGTYAGQAMAILNGILAPYTYWYDHPPLGWIQLAVLSLVPRGLGLGDGTDIGTMRFVICFYFVANAVLIYLVARRIHVARVFALLGTGIFILSPLSLSLGREVFLDTIAMPWTLLAFYLALSPRLALWSHAAAGASFAVAVLTKLTAAIMGPALLMAVIDRQPWRGRAFSIVGFLTIGALILANFPLMALLRGELLSGPGHVSLQDGLLYQFASRTGSGFLWQRGSARQDLLHGWIDGDNFLIVVGIACAVLCLTSRRTRWITVAIATFLTPVVLGSGYLPGMYILAGIPMICIAISTGADVVWRWVTRIAVTRLPNARHVGTAAMVVVLATVIVQIPVGSWFQKDSNLLTANRNADWTRALDWVSTNVPRSDVVVVPYSLWPDLNARGWNDSWKMIALEKVDLDIDFDRNHPRGWREIDWIVEGPSVAANISYLSLTDAGSAFNNSTVVETFGAWNIRRVDQLD